MSTPPEINSINSINTWPIPVNVIVPTTIPAADVAIPIGIMFLAPIIKL